jgi:hypothetical protein
MRVKILGVYLKEVGSPHTWPSRVKIMEVGNIYQCQPESLALLPVEVYKVPQCTVLLELENCFAESVSQDSVLKPKLY